MDGPQLPKRDYPTDDPTKPANTFATIPIELPFLVILPATSPNHSHIKGVETRQEGYLN